MSWDMSPRLPRFQFSPHRLSSLRSSLTSSNKKRLDSPRCSVGHDRRSSLGNRAATRLTTLEPVGQRQTLTRRRVRGPRSRWRGTVDRHGHFRSDRLRAARERRDHPAVEHTERGTSDGIARGGRAEGQRQGRRASGRLAEVQPIPGGAGHALPAKLHVAAEHGGVEAARRWRRARAARGHLEEDFVRSRAQPARVRGRDPKVVVARADVGHRQLRAQAHRERADVGRTRRRTGEQHEAGRGATATSGTPGDQDRGAVDVRRQVGRRSGRHEHRSDDNRHFVRSGALTSAIARKDAHEVGADEGGFHPDLGHVAHARATALSGPVRPRRRVGMTWRPVPASTRV